MFKLLNRKQKTTNNKGFSLVELIVVIAIMAVLIAVLAPAMLKYVENSRKSTDASTVSGIVSTVQAAIIDEAMSQGDYEVVIDANGCTVKTDDTANHIAAALTDAYGAPTGTTYPMKLKATTWKDNNGITITFKVGASGSSSVTYSNSDYTDYITD